MSRSPEKIFPLLKEPGIAITAYGVLSHGLLSGTARPAGKGYCRAHLPRFNGEISNATKGSFGRSAKSRRKNA